MKYKGNVLIVDDDKNVIGALCRLLKYNMYNVYKTTDPEQAIVILDKEEIDIIISDEKMPGKSGIELLKEARIISPETKRIIMTGYNDPETPIKSINEGYVIYYFSKPWDNDELIKVINNIMALKARHDIMKSPIQDLQNAQSNQNRLQSTSGAISSLYKKISIKSKGKFIMISPQDISYIMANKGSIVIHTDASEFEVSMSLTSWENKYVFSNFIKFHRSYIVNIDKVEEIIPWFNNTYNLKLKGKSEVIPVSKKYAHLLKKLFLI